MKIKAIVSDCDGTLIGTEHTLTPAVTKAIKAFFSTGGAFAIATGRAYEGLVEKVYRDLGLTGFAIVRGGSEIVDVSTGEVVWGKYIEKDLVQQLVAELSQYSDMVILAESGKNLYTLDGTGREDFATGATIKKIDELPMDKCPKVAIPAVYTDEVIDPILDKFIKAYPTLHVIKTGTARGVGFDINAGEANKHIAVLEYSKLMNISTDEILGVGDSYNDYPLLSACGVKVAMGNAPQEVKDIADFIVGTQEEDGIVEVINKVMSENVS